jgi:DNA (cytosine-5)-methyltransferase 1
MKVLNLYAGIGGNRKLWPEECEVTAIENNPEIAAIYQSFFPKDKVIVADAHEYLLNHFQEFQFIWSSPPCPTHSGCNNFLNPQGLIRYPDMRLYQEIIFLKHFFKGLWVVENVKPYYEPLITAQESGRHLFWSNFLITNWKDKEKEFMKISILNARASTRRTNTNVLLELQKYHGFNLEKFKLKDKRHALGDCVKPELGLHVFNCAFKTKQEVLK